MQSEEAQDEHHNDNQADEINDAMHLDILQRDPTRHLKIGWIVLVTVLARLGSNHSKYFFNQTWFFMGRDLLVIVG